MPPWIRLERLACIWLRGKDEEHLCDIDAYQKSSIICLKVRDTVFSFISGLSAGLLFTNASDTFMTSGSLIGLEFQLGQSERRVS